MDTEETVTNGPADGTNLSRRQFIKGVGIGGGAVILLGQFGVQAAAWALSRDPVLKMILVDYSKCTGCRTCETVCSSSNRPAVINGKEFPGLGNPRYGNIQVHFSILTWTSPTSARCAPILLA